MIGANLTNQQRKAIYRRDGYRCALCDSTQTIQIHHYIPRGQGGSSSPHNLITLCSACHAHVHGHPQYDTTFTQEDVEQMVVEYLSDYYVETTGEWNPWSAGPP